MIQTLALTILIGVVLTFLTSKMRKLCGYITLICVIIINVVIFSVVIKTFSSEVPLTISQPLFSIPTIGANLLVTVDKLSALFLLLIGIVSLLATLYSIDYMNIYKGESLVKFYPFLILFIGGMMGVVCVSDLFFFFVFWEFMTLTSYFLVIFEKEDPVVLRAGFKYFLMTHIGTAFMFISGVILQSYTGSFNFVNIGLALNIISSTNPVLLHIILALFFLGFATKAGVYPFGTWLPDAHPAAPSGISAILSGIMIKMGIYGIARVFLFMLPVTSHSAIWGGIIASFGTISILIGTFSALIQKDAKRLLAFHSIGQIGYVLLGVGIGISFIKDYPVISAIAIIAGLFHMVNHAFFKSLLFLNTGSILFKTGTKDLNKLSGLWSVMPITTITAVIASLSISGFPPFNGFASKWLIYQVSIIGGIKVPLYILFGVVAIFVSALTMASFLKFLSTAFMGETPDNLGKNIKPENITMNMNISQIILALFCLVLGLFPLLPMSMIYGALANSKIAGVLPQFTALFGNGRNGVSVFIDGIGVGIWKPVFISLVFLICLILAYLIFKLAGAKKREVPVWLCGEEYNKDHVRYKAHSFYLSLQHMIERWFFPHVTFPSVGKPEGVYKLLDFDRILYNPLVELIFDLTRKVRKTHVGIPQVYMLWQVIGIFLVLLILFLFAR